MISSDPNLGLFFDIDEDDIGDDTYDDTGDDDDDDKNNDDCDEYE